MENIYTAAKPLFVFAKFLGLYPYPLNCEKDSKNDTNQVGFAVIWTCFISAILICTSVKMCLNFETLEVNSDLLSSAWKAIVFFDIWSILVLFVYQLLKRKNILNFLTVLNSIDEMVRFKKDKKNFLIFIHFS